MLNGLGGEAMGKQWESNGEALACASGKQWERDGVNG